MTVRSYNFTKQNGVLCKAKKRYTKVSGVKKRILAGWTKQNGVVEQVYEDPSAGFYFIATWDGVWNGNSGNQVRDAYSIDENNIVFTANGCAQLLNNYVTNNSSTVLSNNPIYFVSPQDSGFTERLASYNYSNNSIFSGGRTVYYNELPLNDLTHPTGPRRPSRTYIMAGPIKSDVTGEYYGHYRGGFYKTAADGSQTYLNMLSNNKYYEVVSPGIILEDGHGYYLWVHSNSSSSSAARDFILVKVLNGNTTSINVDSIADSGSPDWCLSGIYTIDGTELFFSFQEGIFGSDTYAHFCKYNVSDGTVTKVLVGRGRQMIGTYDGYIFVLAADSDASNFCTIERYNTSLQLVDSHVIPAQQNLQKLDTSLRKPAGASGFGSEIIYGTITSNSEYVGFACYESIIVLDLAQF